MLYTFSKSGSDSLSEKPSLGTLEPSDALSASADRLNWCVPDLLRREIFRASASPGIPALKMSLIFVLPEYTRRTSWKESTHNDSHDGGPVKRRLARTNPLIKLDSLRKRGGLDNGVVNHGYRTTSYHWYLTTSGQSARYFRIFFQYKGVANNVSVCTTGGTNKGP